MSQSAMRATQNDMTTSCDTSRRTCFGGFPHRRGNFTLTTVVRERLWTPKAGSREHVSTPRPPKCKTRTLCYAFGKKQHGDKFGHPPLNQNCCLLCVCLCAGCVPFITISYQRFIMLPNNSKSSLMFCHWNSIQYDFLLTKTHEKPMKSQCFVGKAPSEFHQIIIHVGSCWSNIVDLP